MRKIKNLKDLTLRRKGFVLINGEFTLPIHTKGDITLQDAMTEYEKSESYKLPKLKAKTATSEQVEELRKNGYPIGIGGVIVVREFDKTDKAWLDFIKERNVIENFMDIAIHIDVNYEFEDKKMWEVLDLKSDNDYLGLIEILREKEFSNEDLIYIKQAISIIRSSNFKTYEDYERAMKITQETLENSYSEEE